MSRYLPPLNALRAFEAAGRHQSFTGSADELNVSHAAISRHVRGLEKQLGVQLFKNVARGVVLTEVGHRYLREVTPALERISQASEQLRCRAEGNLSISCESTFALRWLMPRLGDFRDQFPAIDVTLVSSNKYADIGNNEFDLAIRCCGAVDQGLEFDTISNTPYFPYGSPELPKPDKPEDFLTHGLLNWDTGQMWTRWFAKAGLGEEKIHRSPRPFDSLLAIEGAVAGQGFVLASPELVAIDVNRKRLKKMSSIGLDFVGYFLVYSKQSGRRKAVAAFRKWLAEETIAFRHDAPASQEYADLEHKKGCPKAP
jgi:LysR family glycine cleavage system transcriptional activator